MVQIESQHHLPPIVEEANEEKMQVLIETIEDALGSIRQNREDNHVANHHDIATANHQPATSLTSSNKRNYEHISSSDDVYSGLKMKNNSLLNNNSNIANINNKDQYRIGKFKLVVLMSISFMCILGIVFGFEMLATL
jgi:hypothetical protein